MSHPTDPVPADDIWPPHVPHREIDALLERLRGIGTASPAEASRLLRLVAKEAERLRALALRLTSAKLAEADREASSIIADALGHADSVRSASLSVLNSRLDESERLLAALREAFHVERRAYDAEVRLDPTRPHAPRAQDGEAR